jgi:membrane-associated phospholipid phosphatase
MTEYAPYRIPRATVWWSAAFVVLGLLVQATDFDRLNSFAINHLEPIAPGHGYQLLSGLAEAVVSPGAPLTSAVIIAGAAGLLWARGRRREAVAWALTYPAAIVVEIVCKLLIQQHRSGVWQGFGLTFDSSFPSGHMLRAILIAGILSALWPGPAWRSRLLRRQPASGARLGRLHLLLRHQRPKPGISKALPVAGNDAHAAPRPDMGPEAAGGRVRGDDDGQPVGTVRVLLDAGRLGAAGLRGDGRLELALADPDAVLDIPPAADRDDQGDHRQQDDQRSNPHFHALSVRDGGARVKWQDCGRGGANSGQWIATAHWR